MPELVTDRPDQTESASLVPAGWWQFEGGMTRERDGGTEIRRPAVLGFLLRAGVSGSLEARLGGDFVRQEAGGGEAIAAAEGFEELLVGAKVRIAEDVALFGHLLFTWDDLTPGPSRLVPEVLLAAQRDLSGGFSVAGNLGVDFDPAAVLAFATLTAAYEITGRLGTFAELLGSAGGRSPSLLADGGFTYLLADNLQIDVSGGATLFDVGPSWFIGAGFAVRFPR